MVRRFFSGSRAADTSPPPQCKGDSVMWQWVIFGELILLLAVIVCSVGFIAWQAIDQLRIFRSILNKPNRARHWRDVINEKGNK